MVNKNKMDKNKDLKKSQGKQQPQTTGHSWDGIKEYNVPAPRWWLIVWVATIIWSFAYWFLYPTWPTSSGNSIGSLEWSSIKQLDSSQEEITNRKNKYLEEFSKLSFDEIQKSPELMEFALRGGRASFKENCAACHGSGAAGYKGFPNLNDDDWLWGGTVKDIYTTLLYGIRSGHEKAKFSQMPSFGLDQILNKNQIKDVAQYVLSLSGKGLYNKNGEKIFKANCVSCHGANAKGGQDVGAPNLIDQIWLYGDDKSDLFYTIYYSRAGVMPYWKDRLDNQTIRQLSLYVHSLGGGQ